MNMCNTSLAPDNTYSSRVIHISPMHLTPRGLTGEIKWQTWIQGASTTCYVATNPALKDISGKYYSDCNEASFPTKKATDKYMAAELWKYSEEILASKNVPNYLDFSGSQNDNLL